MRSMLFRKDFLKEVNNGTQRKFCTGVITLSQPVLWSTYFKSGSVLRALYILFRVSDRDRM